MEIIKSLFLFLLAGVCEIGGGYLIWLYIKNDKPFWYAILGGIILALYGIVAAMQTENFGRVYAAYGGIFIALSVLWAWKVDNTTPDKFDIIGALVALIGVYIIFYAPRTTN
jgi:small multidrug resistance family-3 protein